MSSSLDPDSRSRQIAELCLDKLRAQDLEAAFIDLRTTKLERFDNDTIYKKPEYAELHTKIAQADGLLLCTPIYNWSVSSELKRLIEVTGSTTPDGSVHSSVNFIKGAWFDKVVTFAGAAGLPHSYMAFRDLATTLMLDFKCVINPYQIYIHNRHWVAGELSGEAHARIDKTLGVMLELTALLKARSYTSGWEL